VNHRSRSSQETAAFAGEVEGSTNSEVVGEHPRLETVLGRLAEHAVISGLADERENTRPKFRRDRLEPLACAGEVRGAQVAGAARRPLRSVRQPHPEREQLVLLGRLEQTRGEAGRLQQSPEVVPRIGEVGAGLGAHASGVDAAEDDAQVSREDVGKRALGRDVTQRARGPAVSR
jgi:hypothetical protein